jgi:phage baseplate assembly protein V
VTDQSRLFRRVLMTNARVVILATDDSGGVHKAQVHATAREVIDDVPVVQLYGLSTHAPVGSEAHMLCVRGDRSSPVVVATNNPAARPRNLKQGEVTLYTDEGDAITLARGHVVSITTTGTVNVSAPVVNISGPSGGNAQVNVTGNITCSGTIAAHTINAPNGHVGP